MEVDKQKAKETLKRGTFFSFIPHRLEIAGRPELNNFPLNVMFIGWTVRDGQRLSGTAIYEPEFHTHKKDGHLSSMKYRNAYGGDCHLVIAYDEKNKKYVGEKFVNGKLVGLATGGNDWKSFFVHLTMLGLANGERCMFDGLGTEGGKFEVFCDECGKIIRVITLYPEGEGKKNPRPMLKASADGWLCESTAYSFGKDDLTKENLLYIAELLKAENFRELKKIYDNMFDFFCNNCGKSYCVNCWRNTETIYDGYFYDYTISTCPAGHRCEIDD